MNDIQENHLSMFNKDTNFLGEHAAELAGVPSIAAQKAILDQAIADIISNEGLAIEDTTGYKTDKDKKEAALRASILRGCAAVESYGVDTNDDPLQDKMNYQPSELEKLRDMELLGVADLVYKTTETFFNGGNLALYAYIQADFDLFTTSRNAYRLVVTRPKEKIEGKAKAGKVVDDFFVVAFTAIYKNDVFMKNFRTAPNGLYFGYLLSRRIDDNTGGGTGDTTPPAPLVISGTVNPGETKLLTAIPAFTPTAQIKIENGAVELEYGLRQDGGPIIGTPITVPANTMQNTTLGALGASGNELVVFHKGIIPMPETYTVTITV